MAGPSLLLGACLILGGFSACGRSSSPLVVLDEAFVAARPGLAREFRREVGSKRYAVIPLDLGPSLVLDMAKKRGYGLPEGPKTLVTSPLLALALAEGDRELRELSGPSLPGSGLQAGGAGIEALGGAILIVPDYSGPGRDAILGVGRDSREAYAAAGRACGAYIASLGARARPGATGAILFRAGQDSEGIQAFVEAYRGLVGVAPLAEGLEASEDGAVDEEGAVGRLLGKDLALVLVGPGLRLGLVLPRLARPGLALGLAFEDEVPAFPPGQGPAFCIAGDNQGLARLVLARAKPGAKDEAGASSAIAPPPKRQADLLLFDPGKSPDLARFLASEGAKKSKFEKKTLPRR